MSLFPSYRSHYLPALSEKQISERFSQPGHLVLIPFGAVEQHGPHLPVGTDSLIGEIFREGFMQVLASGNGITVMPPLMVTKSNEHSGFPGTLMLQKETLFALLEELLTSLESADGLRQLSITFAINSGN